MIDNQEIGEILEILENLEDEEIAVIYLKKFNDSSKKLGSLLLNLDKSLDHTEWKAKCDQARKELEGIVLEIRSL